MYQGLTGCLKPPEPAVNGDMDDSDIARPHFLKEMLKGVVSVLTVTSSPLYRYPYRNASEAFRGDWKRIGTDVEGAFQALEARGNERP